MKITTLTLFPEFFDSFQKTSIVKRAIADGHVQLNYVNFRDYTDDRHNNVDDTPCGGGAGMLLACQPIVDAIQANKQKHTKVIMLSPQGRVFNQALAQALAKEEDLFLLCGHYEGFDERIRSYVDDEVSIGDYVLTGGESAAMVISDTIIRLQDGVIRKASHEDDSFAYGLLEYPQYTRPIVYNGEKVPDVLMSGHHENIRKWRLKEALRKTYIHRADLLANRELSKEEAVYLTQIKSEEK
ncbi:MAG: tRNA (guanosine(37)-N1)-methyltransferase TrmD [Breznakia sp.]